MTAISSQRYANIDTMRLLAAIAVVFSHAFLIAEGTEEREPLMQLLGHKNILGLYGVFVFFILSGFLITRSFVTRRSTPSYLVSRLLRLLPALWVCVALAAFALGPLFTSLPLGDYLGSRELYGWIARHVSLHWSGGGPLPGVEFYAGPPGTAVLGTYWTLPPEFACYLAVMVAGLLGLLRIPVLVVALIVGLLVHERTLHPLSSVMYLMAFFAAGALLYFVHERGQRPGRGVCWAAGAGLVLSAVAGLPHYGFAVFGAILVIQLATSQRVRLGNGARFGDLSYGLYLFGFPIQQVVRSLGGDGQTWWQNFLISLPIALAAAWLSWHLIERHAVGWAARYRAASAPAGERPAATAGA